MGGSRTGPCMWLWLLILRGCKHVLGLWLGAGDEGSKFWLGILTELRTGA